MWYYCHFGRLYLNILYLYLLYCCNTLFKKNKKYHENVPLADREAYRWRTALSELLPARRTAGGRGTLALAAEAARQRCQTSRGRAEVVPASGNDPYRWRTAARQR